MKFNFFSNMSRLKKKLLLYFLLISIVSISVSAEIILEVSSAKLENEIKSNFYSQIEKIKPGQRAQDIQKVVDHNAVFEPIYKLRNRMILFLIFVSVSIIAAFVLFAKDIVSPMDGIVDATKKIVAGDLTISVPVMTEDEIGLIASLINDMNKNLTDMLNQVRTELNKYKIKLIDSHNTISQLISDEYNEKIIAEKRIRLSKFKNNIKQAKSVINSLTAIIDDLFELQKYLSMYKTYTIRSDLSQNEIDEAVGGYNSTNNAKK